MSTLKPPMTPALHPLGTLIKTPLASIFQPQSVALIGATETLGSVGRSLMVNLMDPSFEGTLYPVHPSRKTVLGLQAWPSVKDLPEAVDLAVICTPAPTVPKVMQQCAEKGVPGAIIISAGFKEQGPEGVALEQQVAAIARDAGMRVVGPNCLGVMVPGWGLNATFAARMAKPGNVGFVSQSGALCTAILDWSIQKNVGFSAFVSLGSMLDVGWGDLIYHLGDDPNTQSIVIYMESVGDARSFLSAAREVALTKPIIVIKGGRSEAAAKAAASHTGSMAGSDAVLDAAFRRAGVLRVQTIAQLFQMAELLAKQPRPKGPNLAIVTNAGGPGVLATDMAVANGAQLAALSQPTMDALNGFLSPFWSHNNPVDLLGDAGAKCYSQATSVVSADPGADGTVVILTPQAMTEVEETAAALAATQREHSKPLLACWMGGESMVRARNLLNQANIPTFDYPDTAVQAFALMWQYSQNLRMLYETPASDASSKRGSDVAASVRQVLEGARAANREFLAPDECAKVLSAYGLPALPYAVVTTPEAAAQAAQAMGFPVVAKLHSLTLTHKTDVGGVKLDLKSPADVANAFEQIRTSVTTHAGAEHFQGVLIQPMVKAEGYELIIGSSVDPQFGPVLLFGTGGQLVEVWQDRVLGLPPLNTTLARRMVERTRIFKALKGVRGRAPVDLEALDQLLVNFSQLVTDHPEIKEIDINPLLATPKGFIALDCRVVLYPKDTQSADLPRAAIRSYPANLATTASLASGENIAIRPIRPDDEPQLVHFHKTLSERSVRFRYWSPMKLDDRISHDRLVRICFNDYDRELALVALDPNESTTPSIIAVARLSKTHGLPEAELAVIVTDAWQRKGLGAVLVKQLMQFAKTEGIEKMRARILAENEGMHRLLNKSGFQFSTPGSRGEMMAEIALV